MQELGRKEGGGRILEGGISVGDYGVFVGMYNSSSGMCAVLVKSDV